MGKRIIQQARGKGGPTYRVSKRAFRFKLQYPSRLLGEGQVVKLFSSAAHSAPLAKISYNGNGSEKNIFYMPAFEGMIEGQKVNFENVQELKEGNILRLKDIPVKTEVYNIETRPGDGGKLIKSAGSSATVSRVVGDKVFLVLPSKKEKGFNMNCRATIGKIAGHGRLEKPIVKAGKQFFIKKAKSKLFPRTSAVKFNAIDHPFGSGRGKRIKPKIAKRNAPAGARVGLIRPRRTGLRKK